MLSRRAGDEFLASVSGVIRATASRRAASRARPSAESQSVYGIYRKTIMQNKSFDGNLRHLRGAHHPGHPWLSATAPWASSTICTTR